MTPFPGNPAPVPIAALMVALAVAGVAAIAHLAARRERVRRRECVTDLARHLDAGAGGDGSIADLVRLVSAADPELFWTAIESATLARRLPLRVVRALRAAPQLADERRALRDDSPWRRELAVRRLALLPSRATRHALRRALRLGPEPVTYAAAMALARHRDGAALGWVLEHPAALAHRTPRARFELLRAFGRAALPRLHAALERGVQDGALERALLDVLGAGAYPPAASAIALRLTHSDAELRLAAARALGRFHTHAAVPILVTLLAAGEWTVRAQAARTLGRNGARLAGGPAVIAALAAGLEDRAWWVRHHAAYALARLGPTGRAELERIAAASSDRYAREMAGEALAAS